LYRYWARLGPTWLPDALVNLTETFGDLAERSRGQDLWRLGRATERPRPLKTWPRDREVETFEDLAERPRGQDLWRLGREAETLEDLTETVEDHRYLADGRPSQWEFGRWPNPITINAQTEISEANPSSRTR